MKIFTNGGLLDEVMSRGLVESGLDEIKISIDAPMRWNSTNCELG